MEKRTFERVGAVSAALVAALSVLYAVAYLLITPSAQRGSNVDHFYRSYLAQSQIFIGIYWQRYGWVAPGEQISGLEDEYRLAAGLPQLLYVKGPAPDREPPLRPRRPRVTLSVPLRPAGTAGLFSSPGVTSAPARRTNTRPLRHRPSGSRCRYR